MSAALSSTNEPPNHLIMLLVIMCSPVQVSGRKFHVLLTSYELLMGVQDKPRLSRINWGGLVVDEGHRCCDACAGR